MNLIIFFLRRPCASETHEPSHNRLRVTDVRCSIDSATEGIRRRFSCRTYEFRVERENVLKNKSKPVNERKRLCFMQTLTTVKQGFVVCFFFFLKRNFYVIFFTES